MNSKTALSNREVYVGVFLIGCLCLMLELIQVRMLSFFLGSISNFLAIPVALFGLALGSMFFHYFGQKQGESIITKYSLAVFPTIVVSFAAFFFITNTFFQDIHAVVNHPSTAVLKLIFYSVMFLPAYFIFGVLLSCYFTTYSDRIGLMYFYDLSGAALGCLITPLLFTYTDLPYVISALILGTVGLVINTTFKFKKPILAITAVVYLVVQVLAVQGILFKEKPNVALLARTLMRNVGSNKVEEIDVRWNEITRTSIIRKKQMHGRSKVHPTIVVQDDGISNVWFVKYDPKQDKKELRKRLHHILPFELGHKPKDVLVVFAGVGKDMVLIDRMADGKANIDGVELNKAVVDAINLPQVQDHNLKKFFNKENITMHVEEGRDFLNKTDGKYDLIFVATNGAVNATRTGHTRKYLDTYEAMSSYLDHLTDDGMIVFVNQPVFKKLYAFKKLFKERNMPNFEKSLIAFGYMNSDTIQSLLIKPSGFKPTDDEVVLDTIRRVDRNQRIFVAENNTGRKDFADAMNATDDEIAAGLLTDDKPFRKQISLALYELFPTAKQFRKVGYAANWIKITTVFIVALVCLVVMLVAKFAGRKNGRLPFIWLLYFLISGISYMLVEIGLIAKTELFMGNPLYAVAVILAVFLLSNSLGAIFQDKYKVMRGLKTMIGFTILSIVWGVGFVTLFNEYLLSIPIFLKILGVFIAVLPSGFVLGTFFPFGVSVLVENGKGDTVPLCYTLATLSSVLGSTFAMTAITNVGFSNVIIAGAAGYCLVAFLFIGAKKFSFR